MTLERQKVLTQKQEILDYLNISDTLFRKFVAMGMPARFMDGRWYAHTDNLDGFFKHMTLFDNRHNPNLDQQIA